VTNARYCCAAPVPGSTVVSGAAVIGGAAVVARAAVVVVASGDVGTNVLSKTAVDATDDSCSLESPHDPTMKRASIEIRRNGPNMGSMVNSTGRILNPRRSRTRSGQPFPDPVRNRLTRTMTRGRPCSVHGGQARGEARRDRQRPATVDG